MLAELFSQPFTLWGAIVLFVSFFGFAWMCIESVMHPPVLKDKKEN